MRMLVAAAFAAAVIVVQAPATANVVFDLTGNNTLADASGNGANGSWAGSAIYAPIGSTTGFYFNASNSVHVPAAQIGSVPAGQVVKLSAFVASDASFLSSERIIDKATVGQSDGYLLDIVYDHFRVIMGGATLYSSMFVAPFTDYHVTAVYDGTRATPTVGIYVNGVLDALTTAGAFSNGTQDLRIGEDSLGGSHFGGVIADAKLSYANTVPEPASWAMLVTGFGLVGAAARRRQVKTVAA